MFPCMLVLAAMLASGACEMQPASGAGAGQVLVGDTTDPPRLRRVWDVARSYASPSPDGQLITFVDWSTGDVAVHELATGEDRLATDKGTWTENGSWAEHPVFSPDGRRIVYTYGNTRAGDRYRYELRSVELGDTTQRLLHALDTDSESWIRPYDWHPRAGILIGLVRLDDSGDLAVMPEAGGEPRVIRSFEAGEPGVYAAEFSADASLIVYQLGGDVRTVRADGSADRSLDIGRAKLLALLPSGRVLVHAERDGRRGIWAVSLEDGRRAGDPVLVRDGIPLLEPGGLAANGYFYSVPVDGPRIYMSAVDVAAGRSLMQPIALTSPGDGWAAAPAWSPDGRKIAYILSNPGESSRVMLRAAEGDHVRELARLPFDGRAENFVWTNDGGSLLFIGEGARGPALYELAVATGRVRRLFEPAGGRFVLTPDERSLVLSRQGGIFVRDRASGSERLLVSRRAGSAELAISPDGQTVAFMRRDTLGSRIYTIPFAGGSEQLVVHLPLERHLEGPGASMAFTADGRHLLAVRGDAENRHDLVAIDLATGAVASIVDLGQRPDGPERAHARLHPDGRRIVYAHGYERGEMWLMEDVPD